MREIYRRIISYVFTIVAACSMVLLGVTLSGTRMFVIMPVSLIMLTTLLLNYLVSARIEKTLQKTLESTVEQLRQLMQDNLMEPEEKRKSELDALQSQINPHFLYNTLDSIVWMIEGERYDDAVFMITQLASLFRISLSRGNTIISIEDEIRHAKNYMSIQKIRYKNIFSISFDIEEEILSCCTVKLVIQPLLENAIYYGVECMDGDGEIEVRGYRRGDDIYIEVCDNGLGMPEETVKQLLTVNNRVRKHGSGVGLINVHKRLQLQFGKPYGLEIESAPDEGTRVRIHLPAISYTAESVDALEGGKREREKTM